LAAGRRVLVTGGTSTLGAAVAERLATKGDSVVITGRSQDRGTTVAEATGSVFIPGDIQEAGAVERIVRAAEKSLGGLDGLVLCAGVLHTARISETSDTDWDTLIDTNLIAPFMFARACMPALAADGGAIVAVASGTALWTEMELGAYSVSKRALLWMTQMLAVEGGPKGVTANAVCPGDTVAGMTSLVSAPSRRDLGPPATPPLGRLVAPADVAAAVDFFLGVDAAFCTGTSLTVDGGMRAALRANRVHS
jgi:NAD(P)-dependent dehydrogenase (short-subunit alcohol dehydrogenase family)